MKTFPQLLTILLFCVLVTSCTNGGGNNPMNDDEKEIDPSSITDRVSTFNHFSELEIYEASYNLPNGNFESGDLTGFYKEDNTSAFEVTDDEVDIWENPVAKTGKYFMGFGKSNYNATTESYTGKIRSSLFKIGGNGTISFSLAGNCTDNLSVCLYKYSKNGEKELIRKFNNTRFSQGGLSGFILVPYLLNVDLNKYENSLCYLEFSDEAKESFGFISVDNIITYYPKTTESTHFFTSLASFCNPITVDEAIANATLTSIEFDPLTRTEFNYCEDFNSDNLMVYGIYSNGIKTVIPRDKIAVNKSQYKKNVPGDYDIQVMVVGTAVAKTLSVKVLNEGEYIRGTQAVSDSDGLLVFGDSQMAMWSNIRKDIGVFSNVENVAIGGSTTDDWLSKIDLLCTKQSPFVLLNLGGNDLRNRAKKPSEIASNIETIIKKFAEKSPNTHIYMFEISCGPATFYNYFDLANETNSLYKEFEKKYNNFTLISIKAGMFNNEGMPDDSKYRDDHLHIHPDAYYVYANAFKKYLIDR